MPQKSDEIASKEDFTALIKDLGNSLNTHLKEMVAKLFIEADEKLFDLADSAVTNEDQARYFELLRNLRDAKPDISVDFIENIHKLLKPFAEAEAEKQQTKDDSETELSLVDQDDMEDMVLIKRVGGEAAGRFREAISHLEARLEHLALQTPDIFAKDALDPTNITQAFDDALGGRFDIPNKKVLFELFENNVTYKLDTIYDALNNMLIEAGILPQIKLHAEKSKSRQRPTPPPQEMAEGDGDGEDFDQPINQGGYAMTAAPGHGGASGGASGGAAGGQASTTSGGLPQSEGASGHAGPASTSGGHGQQGSYGQTAGSAQADGTTGSEGGTAHGSGGQYQHTTAGLPANQVSNAISEYMGSPIMPAPQAGEEPGESYPAGDAQYYGHDAVLQALSNIQLTPEFSGSEEGELKYDSEAIKQAVLSEIAKTSGGVVTKRLNRIAEKTIDFIELVFDAIIEDDSISDTIKALLLRLQIPVIKASMVDQEFFIYDDHPARMLLDRIAEVGIGITEHTDEIYIELDKIITRLVNEFELQTSTFQDALDELNAFVHDRDEAARKQEEETQRQVLREHARNTVLKSLRDTTTGKTLPQAIHPLVLKRWPTLMYNHYLTHGKENDEWVTIIEILRDIINSVQPLRNRSDLDYLLGTRDKLVKTAHTYLNRTTQCKEDIETVIRGLKETHDLHISQADFPEISPEEASQQQETEAAIGETATEQQEEQAAETETTVTPIEPARKEPAGPQLPPSIMPGMWFKLYMGEDKPPRRGKLSVIIVQDSKLVFVNYQGGIIVEKSFEEFIEEIDEGKSAIIMGHSAFDHALNRVVTSLNN